MNAKCVILKVRFTFKNCAYVGHCTVTIKSETNRNGVPESMAIHESDVRKRRNIFPRSNV